MECLKLHSQKADRCMELAKQYLQCRMDRCVSHAHFLVKRTYHVHM